MIDPLAVAFVMMFCIVLLLCYKADRKVQYVKFENKKLRRKVHGLEGEVAYLQRRATQYIERRYQDARPVDVTKVETIQ